LEDPQRSDEDMNEPNQSTLLPLLQQIASQIEYRIYDDFALLPFTNDWVFPKGITLLTSKGGCFCPQYCVQASLVMLEAEHPIHFFSNRVSSVNLLEQFICIDAGISCPGWHIEDLDTLTAERLYDSFNFFKGLDKLMIENIAALSEEDILAKVMAAEYVSSSVIFIDGVQGFDQPLSANALAMLDKFVEEKRLRMVIVGDANNVASISNIQHRAKLCMQLDEVNEGVVSCQLRYSHGSLRHTTLNYDRYKDQFVSKM
jgi:hypothetical protein